jgi:hypothetical protein
MTDRYTLGWDKHRHKGDRMGSLWCIKNDVDGDVTLSEAYDELYSLAKLDLIRDWIGLLEREYTIVYEKWQNELAELDGEKND